MHRESDADVSKYDPIDEYPVLEKLKAAGWIVRYWADRQDIYAEWTSLGNERMRNWRQHVNELALETANQHKVMDFFSRYLAHLQTDA
jgi:DNA-binding PadR family transcriptional regulator